MKVQYAHPLTENTNFGGGYKVTTVTSGELVALPCKAIKLLTASEWGKWNSRSIEVKVQ